MSLINNILLLFINIIHLIVILLIIIIPFTGSNYLLLLYIIILPFILLHWVLNNNTCCLTVFEQKIREKLNGETIDKEETYMHKIIAPIYDFKKNNNNLSFFIYTITIILWLISCNGLYSNYKNNKLNSFKDLFEK
jgi:hypothetical protein